MLKNIFIFLVLVIAIPTQIFAQIYNPSSGGGAPGGSNGQIQYNNNGALGGLANGQIPGTATNDNATAGNVGEFISSGVPNTTATITVTIASPAVVTWPANIFASTGTASIVPVVFTTTGALPTGITAGTVYYTIPSTYSGSTFQIATSLDNAIAGTAVNTSGSQSGTQTGTSGQVLSTGVTGTVTAVRLSAGDWSVNGNAGFNADTTTTATAYFSSLSTTLNTFPTYPDQGARGTLQGGFSATQATQTVPIGSTRFSLSSPATVYLIEQSTFATSFMRGNGFIGARRMR